MKNSVHLCVALAILLSGPAGLGAGTVEKISLEIRDETVGVSPQVMGINIGHFVEGGDALDGFRRLGVNGVRIFFNLRNILPLLESPADEAKISTEADFLSARQKLTEDPLGSGLIDWKDLAKGWEQHKGKGINKMDTAWAFEQLSEAGLDILLQATCTPGTIAFEGPEDWKNRWIFWRGYFALARYLGERYGVERYQMYNEPDLHAIKRDREDYIERLRLASDAIQSAFRSLPTAPERERQPKIYAPVTAQFKEEWAEAVLSILEKPRFPDGPTPVFQMFAYQSYGHSPARFTERLQDAQNFLAEFPGATDMPIAVTEFNVYTNRDFFEKKHSLDDPKIYARLGGIYASLISGGARELYVFKFSQTDGRDEIGIRRNGLFIVDNENPPYRTERLTGGGEVAALFSSAFQGEAPLLRVVGDEIGKEKRFHAVAVTDAGRRSLHLALVNEKSDPVQWEITLPERLLSPWQKVSLQTVEGRGGEISRRTLTPEPNARLRVPQSAGSVSLLSIQ